MKTQMTRAQLREAIALKRGYRWVCWPDAMPQRRWLENMDRRIGSRQPIECGKEIGELYNALGNVPDYLNSMDAALPLLRELPRYRMTSFSVAYTNKRSLHHIPIMEGKEAEAVACAWWQFTTGEVVELVEESDAQWPVGESTILGSGDARVDLGLPQKEKP